MNKHIATHFSKQKTEMIMKFSVNATKLFVTGFSCFLGVNSVQNVIGLHWLLGMESIENTCLDSGNNEFR